MGRNEGKAEDVGHKSRNLSRACVVTFYDKPRNPFHSTMNGLYRALTKDKRLHEERTRFSQKGKSKFTFALHLRSEEGSPYIQFSPQRSRNHLHRSLHDN